MFLNHLISSHLITLSQQLSTLFINTSHSTPKQTITMKFSAITAAAALVGAASAANKAVVINECDTAIYVQSVPFNGGAAGPLTTLKPGQRFSEDLRTPGSTIKIADTRTLNKPLFFGYSSDANNVYYELNTEYGNPFANKHNILNPGDGCQKFDCKAGDAKCYSTPSSKKNYGCPNPVTLYAKICAK
ncbi:alkaline foam protein B precursor [Fusarium venenatum]|nr:alkaline foam protein B precursor [Fusarium venenatum]